MIFFKNPKQQTINMYLYRLPHIFSYKIIMWGQKGMEQAEEKKEKIGGDNKRGSR